MYILLYIAILLVNSLFMMLTTLLPVLIYNMTKSTTYVGEILTTFMISLVIIRVFCMRYDIKTRYLFLFGSVTFTIGFLLIYAINNNIWIYYLGAIFFGASIAVLSPTLLTILTNSTSDNTKNISVYNSLIAISSAISPIAAELLLKRSLSFITTCWLIGVVILLSISIYMFLIMRMNYEVTINDISEKKLVCKNKIFVLRTYKNILIILFLTSISYGAIISYLPVYYTTVKNSIGVFYLFFWGCYVLAQGISNRVANKLKKDTIILLCLLGLLLSQASINLFSGIINEILISSIYGFCYGLLYNVFYKIISRYENEHTRANGFALVGLMSYIGVGVAPIFLYPFLPDLNTLFLQSSVYTGVAVIYFCVNNRKEIK